MNGKMGLGLLAAMAFGCGVGTASPTATAAPGSGTALAASPQAFSFGDVPVGTSTTRDVTLSNTGTAAAQITNLTVTGPGFSATGLPVPLTLAPGASTTVTVGFAPPATGTFTGDVILASAAVDLVVIAPTGTGVTGGTPPAASIDSVTVNPASVVAGRTAQMTATVAATGTIDKSVTWAVAAGSLGSIGSTTGVYTAPSTAGTYVVMATSTADPTRSGSGTVTVTGGSPPGPTGTGAGYSSTYITTTGGGAMPNWATNVVTASCAGNGVTDDTSCLQAAADSAHSQNRPLVIPYTSAFYKVSGRITIYTSVGGVGGMPTIKTTIMSGNGSGTIFVLAPSMTGWIYNLHLVGTFSGNNASGGEWSHNIDIGSVNGVTIKGNLLENAMGDALGTDRSAFDGGGGVSQNIIVDNNTIKNPYRCGVALVKNQTNWVISNNIMDKQDNYVSGIDFEPEAGTVTNVEVTYNKFVMNNRTVNPSRSSDGQAVSGWMVPTSPNPGGNYYLHHNYGTFGTGFAGFGGNFGYIFQQSNVEGTSPPP